MTDKTWVRVPINCGVMGCQREDGGGCHWARASDNGGVWCGLYNGPIDKAGNRLRICLDLEIEKYSDD